MRPASQKLIALAPTALPGVCDEAVGAVRKCTSGSVECAEGAGHTRLEAATFVDLPN